MPDKTADFLYNIIGEKLLLNLIWREISALIYNFACEITRLPWQSSVRLSAKMASIFCKRRFRQLIKTLERAYQEGFHQVFCRKILKSYEIKPVLSFTVPKGSANY